MEAQASQSGFNEWTIPWDSPDCEEIEQLRLGRFRPPEYDLPSGVVETYQRDGVAFLKGAFADWVEPLRAGLARNVANPDSYRFPAESTAPGEPGRFFDSYCNWPLIPEYRDFVFHSPAASIAGQVMQATQAQFFHEHAFLKEPGTQKATPWHQDMPYYCVTGNQTCSVYVALDQVDLDLSVKYVKGSHLWDKLYHPKVWLDGEDFNTADKTMEPVPDISANLDAYDIASWALEPGDTILFTFRTLHGTSDGEMRKGRSAFSTRWMGDDVRYCERPGETTSPPYEDHDMQEGDRMREDWFPVVWRKSLTA